MEYLTTSVPGFLSPKGPDDLSMIYYAGGLLTVITVWLAYVVHRDYDKWLVFGNGNPPNTCNFTGYCVYMWYKYTLALKRYDPLCEKALRLVVGGPAYLDETSLPSRSGMRPRLVPWILPHRQAPPYTHDEDVAAAICTLQEDVVQEWQAKHKDHADAVYVGLSRPEGIGLGILLQDGTPSVHPDAQTTFNEVCHLHQQDLSFHAILSPADAALVVERKWGERFAMAGRRMTIGRLKGRIVPPGYVLLYAPRTLEEVAIVKNIVAAAVDFGLNLPADK